MGHVKPDYFMCVTKDLDINSWFDLYKYLSYIFLNVAFHLSTKTLYQILFGFKYFIYILSSQVFATTTSKYSIHKLLIDRTYQKYY